MVLCGNVLVLVVYVGNVGGFFLLLCCLDDLLVCYCMNVLVEVVFVL